MKVRVAFFRSSLGIPFKPGALVGIDDMPSPAVIPGWVSIASPLRYLAPIVRTNNSKRNQAEVMVMPINLLAAILLCLSQSNKIWKEEIERKRRRERKRL